MKTKEEILEKNGFDFELFEIENEYSAKNLLLAMEEYAQEYAQEYFNDKVDKLSLRLIGIQCFAEDNYTNAAYKAVARAFDDIKQWIKANRVQLG